MSYDTLSGLLTGVADAIREKDGTTDTINAQDFPDRIAAITTGSDTSDATATADDILSGKTAYTADGLVTGTIATSTTWNQTSDLNTATGGVAITLTPANNVYVENTASIGGSIIIGSYIPSTPTVSISDAGLITANATYSNGYITSGNAGTKTATLDVGTATLSTPSLSINSSGTVTGRATMSSGYSTASTTKSNSVSLSSLDSNFTAANIASGVTIFGTTGTYEGEAGLDTSDATATASDILSGKTAYVDGEKITGTISSSTLDDPILTFNADTGLITAVASCSSGYSSGQATSTSAYAYDLDSDFVASNIKSGVTILGVTGTYGAVEYVGVTGADSSNITSVLPSSTYFRFIGAIAYSDYTDFFALFNATKYYTVDAGDVTLICSTPQLYVSGTKIYVYNAGLSKQDTIPISNIALMHGVYYIP